MRSLIGALSRAYRRLAHFIFNPIRTSELIVCCASTWWCVAILLPDTTLAFSALERAFSNNLYLVALFILVAILLWVNFFRLIERIRWAVLIVAVAWWVFATALVILSRPSAPGVAPYLGMVWLSIFNAIENSKEDAAKRELDA